MWQWTVSGTCTPGSKPCSSPSIDSSHRTDTALLLLLLLSCQLSAVQQQVPARMPCAFPGSTMHGSKASVQDSAISYADACPPGHTFVVLNLLLPPNSHSCDTTITPAMLGVPIQHSELVTEVGPAPYLHNTGELTDWSNH